MEHKDLRYWLALLRAPGIGPVKFLQLVKYFSPLQELFKEVAIAHLCKNGLADMTAHYLRNPDWLGVDNDLAWLAQDSQRSIVTYQDSCYPEHLKEISSAPVVLFLQGDSALLKNKQLAIVGSRNASPTGLQHAMAFARELVSAGLTITSGLALGIDAAAHQGALGVKGKTIAVLGCGLDIIYPRRHITLARAISEQGLLVSEFPIGTAPQAGNFPQRNRVISGLSLGVLVVEAALRSGSLITAQYAVEQGREVFAIPGSIRNVLARGSHQLLRQGAKLVETIEDILEEINYTPVFKVASQARENQQVEIACLAKSYNVLLECMGFEPVTIDLVMDRTNLPANEVSAMLLDLELQGLITTVPGGYLRLT